MVPLINFLGKEINIYTLVSLIGVFVSGIYGLKVGKRRGLDENDFILLLVVFAIGLFFGSHLLFGITNINKIIVIINNFSKITSFSMFMSYFKLVFGGAVFYGGLLGGLITLNIYAKIKKIDISKHKDIIACGIPLFHFFGRIGCFLGGCCFGIESKIGFTYHHSLIESANHVKRFPVQLVEASLCLGIFFLLNNFLKNNKYKNNLLYIYFLLYSVIRFFLEFLRGDSYRGFLFSLSTSQIISIILFIYSGYKLMKTSDKINIE